MTWQYKIALNIVRSDCQVAKVKGHQTQHSLNMLNI